MVDKKTVQTGPKKTDTGGTLTSWTITLQRPRQMFTKNMFEEHTDDQNYATQESVEVILKKARRA